MPRSIWRKSQPASALSSVLQLPALRPSSLKPRSAFLNRFAAQLPARRSNFEKPPVLAADRLAVARASIDLEHLSSPPPIHHAVARATNRRRETLTAPRFGGSSSGCPNNDPPSRNLLGASRLFASQLPTRRFSRKKPSRRPAAQPRHSRPCRDCAPRNLLGLPRHRLTAQFPTRSFDVEEPSRRLVISPSRSCPRDSLMPRNLFGASSPHHRAVSRAIIRCRGTFPAPRHFITAQFPTR